MINTFSRISLVAVALVGLNGMASARDAARPKTKHHATTVDGFKPAFRADTSVSGAARPYSWPVSDRYRPVSQPYFGRAF